MTMLVYIRGEKKLCSTCEFPGNKTSNGCKYITKCLDAFEMFIYVYTITHTQYVLFEDTLYIIDVEWGKAEGRQYKLYQCTSLYQMVNNRYLL